MNMNLNIFCKSNNCPVTSLSLSYFHSFLYCLFWDVISVLEKESHDLKVLVLSWINSKVRTAFDCSEEFGSEYVVHWTKLGKVVRWSFLSDIKRRLSDDWEEFWTKRFLESFIGRPRKLLTFLSGTEVNPRSIKIVSRKQIYFSSQDFGVTQVNIDIQKKINENAWFLLLTSHSIISGIWSLDWDECIEQPPGSCKDTTADQRDLLKLGTTHATSHQSIGFN